MIQVKHILAVTLVVILLLSCSLLHKTNKNNSAKQAPGLAISGKDSTAKSADSNKNKIKPYKEIITENAITDSGLIILHRIQDRFFFEIPDSILNRDILIVSRIIKAAADNRPFTIYGYSGDQIGESIIQLTKGPNEKLFIRRTSYTERSTDTSENGLFKTVHNSNLQPIVESFDIKTISPNKNNVVIDVTDFITGDNSLLFFQSATKKDYGLGGLMKDKSYFISLQSFPVNVELKVVNTYGKGEGTATYELNTSIVLLPKTPMHQRKWDERVGYFFREYMDFDAPQGAKNYAMATRWRLEPSDKDKYFNGELVEPEKPIVYYVDPATPKKWIPYIIQGVNDWQKAFEKAGFKNAIYALEAPEQDSSWSLYDARHNAIVYKASSVANASGPHINDPRNGEILETHINLYHNVLQLMHDWYMIQEGPNDTRAQKMLFDDDLMGRLLRYVICHEVGHTLGLTHNFGASSSVPVDSLRSVEYVKKNGFCPSIMDYARFNYVAQPEDGFLPEELLPRIGVYDEWAIEWGYRYFQGFPTKEQENLYLTKWVTEQLKKNPKLRFGQQQMMVLDPRDQPEDMGDDAMKAGKLGLNNLKKVMMHLIPWTSDPNSNYEPLKRIYNEVVSQFMRYAMHVSANATLYTWSPRTMGEAGAVVGYVPKEKRKSAVEYLNKNVFETQEWLMNKKLFTLIGGEGPLQSGKLQEIVLNSLMEFDPYVRLMFANAAAPSDQVYSFDELLNDLENGIWKELRTRTPIESTRRNLQKIYIGKLIKLIDIKQASDPFTQAMNKFKLESDFLPIIQTHINTLLVKIDASLKVNSWDKTSKSHLAVSKKRLKEALTIEGAATINPTNGQRRTLNDQELFKYPGSDRKPISVLEAAKFLDCWPPTIREK